MTSLDPHSRVGLNISCYTGHEFDSTSRTSLLGIESSSQRRTSSTIDQYNDNVQYRDIAEDNENASDMTCSEYRAMTLSIIYEASDTARGVYMRYM